jgi:protease IV
VNDTNDSMPTDAQANQALMEKILLQGFEEQRKARRWGVFFKLLTFAYLFFILVAFLVRSDGLPGHADPKFKDHKQHTALIKIEGAIADDQPASANVIVTGLRKAFEDEQTKAILIKINSPGGSPVQAGYVYDEINRLRTEHPDIKVYAVIAELGASAAYYIASAADEIYADKASLIGSIGVTGAGFGFVEAIEKLGIERRNFTSGKHKSFLDPFQPLKQDEKEFWEGVMGVVHQQFISAVEAGRGDRLQKIDDLYSGLIWPGQRALEIGLIDGLGSPGYVAREIIAEEKIVDFTPAASPLERFTKLLGASVGEGVVNYFVSRQNQGVDGMLQAPDVN